MLDFSMGVKVSLEEIRLELVSFVGFVRETPNVD